MPKWWGGVGAALYFGNHQERGLCVVRGMGYIRQPLSVSRFNQRLHALCDLLRLVLETLTGLAREGEAFIIDSMPLPMCKRVRASRCRKLRGKVYYGYCATKDEHFFGLRLHLVCDCAGVPVAFSVQPASVHDTRPAEALLTALPSGARGR